MLKLTTSLLILSLSNMANADIFFKIPAELHEINSPPSALEVINPFTKIEGVQIKGVKFSVDGSWYEYTCSIDERTKDKSKCGKSIEIQPGAHVFYAALCSDPECSITGKAWTMKKKINLGVREKLSIDLSKDGQLSRLSLSKKKPSECTAALESVFYVNTCRADGVLEYKDRLSKLSKSCDAALGKDSYLQLLLELAAWQVSYLSPQRCYYSQEIDRLPEFLTSWYVPDGFWPKGTVQRHQSSWSWARSPMGEIDSRKSKLEFKNQLIMEATNWANRQLVVDELIDTILDPAKGIPAIAASSAKTKFDLNPVEPDGHRNFGLSVIAQAQPKIAKDPRISQILEKGAQKATNDSGDSSTHCGLTPEVSNLIKAMKSDKAITKGEWSSIKKLLERTPDDISLKGCSEILDARLKGEVPTADIFHTFAQLDCSKKRKDDVRGKATMNRIEPSMSSDLIPPAERIKILKSYPDCIYFENGPDNERIEKKVFKGFDVEKLFYETNNIRKIRLSESGKFSGNSVEAFYFPNGKLGRIVCGPSYAYSINECKSRFPFDISKLIELTK